MMTLEERKKNRQLMLGTIYDLTQGQAEYKSSIDLWDVGQRLGWDRETIEMTYDHLQGEGLLEATTLGGGITMTPQGVKEVARTRGIPLYKRLVYRVRVPEQESTDYPP